MKGALAASILLLALVSTVVCGPILSSKSALKNANSEEELPKEDLTESDNVVTDEEKQFLKEIEEKYNTKPEKDGDSPLTPPKRVSPAPLPAVIAIEIVNDNSTDGKGKRTIGANLGYGYKTNGGYIYSQFGKPPEAGKFMIYPYSQHDIPPTNYNGQHKYTKTIYTNKLNGEKTHVEIQPSKAYQLVPIDSHEEQDSSSYGLHDGVSQLRTEYERVQAVESPPPPYPEPPTTLYSTYSGGRLSGLSGHFPTVLPDYFVSPAQILGHPQYRGLRLQSPAPEQLPQRHVIPVLILRIPSSHIRAPTATFYPELPHGNPYAMSLNNINLQSIVKQYLANLQPQYEAVAPEPEQKYEPYSPPVHYYQPQQPIYSVPSINDVQYAQPPPPPPLQYLPTSQPPYAQSVHSSEQAPAHQAVRYVIPHPSAEGAQGPVSHASFSQVYSPQRAQPLPEGPQFDAADETQSLPISENYPDSAHTRVLLAPRYRPGGAAAAQPIRVTHQHYSQSPGTDARDRGEAESSSDEDEQQKLQPPPSRVPPHAPYNFHAHPIPERQAEPAGRARRRPAHPSP